MKLTKRELTAMKEVVEMFMPDEKKHWEELEKPQTHIYNSLRIISKIIERGGYRQ